MENEIMKGRDIIMFGLQPWDIPIGSNFKNIASVMAKDNRVLYVNRPLDRISQYRKKNDGQVKARQESVKAGKNVISETEPNLFVFNPRIIIESINWMPPGYFYNFFNRQNNKKLAREITWASAELNFEKPILIIDDDFFNGLHLKEYLKPSLFIYYIRDFLLSQQYFVKHGHRAEPMMMKKADGVAANSAYLANYARKHNSNVADVGQGCDVQDFIHAPVEVPADIKSIAYPVIGYIGSLTSTRLDISLIDFIARQKPEWNIVLVGPEDENFKKSSLHGLANVHFLGSKKPAELPAYVHSFDVAMNPQVLNQMTIGNYPRKVDEYLAAGKPVVATKTEAMAMFEEFSFLCETNEEYIDAIMHALAEAKDSIRIEGRRALGESHTWEASVNLLYQLIHKTEKNAG